MEYQTLVTNTSGNIKWIDSRDGEGVVKDAEGNEYYFESSSSKLFDFAMRNHINVTFTVKVVPYYRPMAFDVKSGYSSNVKGA